jgi:hypothetical protein
MGHLLELGRRLELVSMDPHFHDISISLYEVADDAGAHSVLAHTYSGKDGAQARIGFVMRAMTALGGMVPAPGQPGRLAFSCGSVHQAAVKRLFIEACKLAQGAELSPRPMRIFDKKNDLTIEATNLGGGRYRLSTETEGEKVARRIDGVTRGLVKLAELDPSETADQASFPCGHSHDELIGLLLGRALNVRAAMREAEAAATRGVLAAPSAQAQA